MVKSQLLNILKLKYIQILICILLYSIFSENINIFYKSLFYSIGLLIKTAIVWAMPLTVAAYVAHTMKHFGKNAFVFLITLTFFEFFSNYASVWFTYGAAHVLVGNIFLLPSNEGSPSLELLFQFPFSKPWWYSADKGVILGILMGFICKNTVIAKYKSIADFILTKIFAKLIPIFVLGIYINMDYQRVIHGLVKNYGVLVLMYGLVVIVYSFLIYIIGSGFSLKKALIHIKNMMPAWIVGFTTGCSMSTMPLTIKCTEKNLKSKSLAGGLIPATTNIQQIADCIMMSFVGCFLYHFYFGHLPDIFEWFKFSVVYTLARFTVTAVVGGAIFILLPIFEQFLGFSSEMVMIFITINMILDPMVTAFNILANGGMAIIFEKFISFFPQKNKMGDVSS